MKNRLLLLVLAALSIFSIVAIYGQEECLTLDYFEKHPAVYVSTRYEPKVTLQQGQASFGREKIPYAEQRPDEDGSRVYVGVLEERYNGILTVKIDDVTFSVEISKEALKDGFIEAVTIFNGKQYRMDMVIERKYSPVNVCHEEHGKVTTGLAYYYITVAYLSPGRSVEL